MFLLPTPTLTLKSVYPRNIVYLALKTVSELTVLSYL